MQFTVKRLLIESDPFKADQPKENPFGYYQWPARWIWPKNLIQDKPVVFVARIHFTVKTSSLIRFHATADQQFELFLNETRIATGPETSDLNHWMYSSYEVELPEGEYSFSSRVVWAGDQAGFAQMTSRPGFLFAVEGDFSNSLSTGMGDWRVKVLEGYRFIRDTITCIAPPRVIYDMRTANTNWLYEKTDFWQKPVVGPFGILDHHTDQSPLWKIRPSMLPPQIEELISWGTVRHVSKIKSNNTLYSPQTNNLDLQKEFKDFLQNKNSITIPSNSHIRVLVDLEHYRCAFVNLEVVNGDRSWVSIIWSESLYKIRPSEKYLERLWDGKGDRSEINNKHFFGFGDKWRLDGNKNNLESIYWRAGRYVLFDIRTSDTPLTLLKCKLIQTGYPLNFNYSLQTSYSQINSFIPLLTTTLQTCAHYTYMDCPYYERLMYVGDTRLEALVTYVSTNDSLLPKKAIQMFDWSRDSRSLTSSRYPTRYRQEIPGFSLWWIGCVYDYAFWRNDLAFVKEMLPGVRSILNFFIDKLSTDNLLPPLPGWCFSDWSWGWRYGVASGFENGDCGIYNWQLILALQWAQQLETHFGNNHYVNYFKTIENQMYESLNVYWDEKRSLFSEDRKHTFFSEHSQCLALLTKQLSPDQQEQILNAMLMGTDLNRTSIYYSHYLFEALAQLNKVDIMLDRFSLWKNLHKVHFVTTPEQPEPSRSDCHAWGSHPLYHIIASILGIRPTSPGFKSIQIRPQLGSLSSVNTTIPHPEGSISVNFRKKDSQITGEITIPSGIPGTLILGNESFSFSKKIAI